MHHGLFELVELGCVPNGTIVDCKGPNLAHLSRPGKFIGMRGLSEDLEHPCWAGDDVTLSSWLILVLYVLLVSGPPPLALVICTTSGRIY